MRWLSYRWLKLALATGMPLLIYVVLSERSSWRPRTLATGLNNVSLAFTSDGSALAVSGAFFGKSAEPRVMRVQLWNTHSSALIKEHTEQRRAHTLHLSPDAGTIINVAETSNVGLDKSNLHTSRSLITLSDIRTGQSRYSLTRPHPATATMAIALAPDAGLMAEAYLYNPVEVEGEITFQSERVVLWNLKTQQLQRVLFERHLNPAPNNRKQNTRHRPEKLVIWTSLRFAADSQTVFGISNWLLQLWEVSSGKVLWKEQAELEHTQGTARSVLSHHTAPPYQEINAVGEITGKQVAEGRIVLDLKLWDGQRRIARHRLNNFVVIPWCATLSPDGKLLATNDSNPKETMRIESGLMRLWDLKTGELLHSLQSYIWSPLAFSPDNKVLARASRFSVELWDIASWRQQRVLSGHKKRITTLAFSPDGSTLACAGEDGIVKLWRIK